MKKILGVLLTILILTSSLALTANAEVNTDDLTPATADEAKAFNAENYDYKSLLNTNISDPRYNESEIKTADYIGKINETERDCIVLVHATGYPVAESIEYTEIGDYVFASAEYIPNKLGLYVVWFTNFKLGKPTAESNGMYVSYVDTLENAAKSIMVNMRDVYHTIEKAQKEKGYLGFTVEHKDGELGEKIAAAVEEKYGASDAQEILGEIDDDKYLVYCANRIVLPAIYEENIAWWKFVNGNYVHNYPLGLYVINGDKAYSLIDAYRWRVITDSEIDKIAELAKKCVHVERTADEDIVKAVEKDFDKHDHYEVIGVYGEASLVYAHNDLMNMADYTERIANYTFYVGTQAARYELGLYIVKDGKAYSLKQAYADGVITDSDIAKIAEDVNSKIGKIATEDISYSSYKAMADKYGKAEYFDSLFFNNLGQVKDINVISASTTALGPAPYTEKLGEYEFKTMNNCYNYPLGIYIVRNNKAYTLKEAYDKKVISDAELGEIAKLKLYNMHEYVEVVKTEVIIPHTTEKPALKLKVSNKTVKASKLKKSKVTVKPLTIKNVKGKVKVTKVKKGTSSKIYKKIKVNSKGAVTLAKGKYKKGTYKIKLKITAVRCKTLYKTVKIRIK